MKQFFAAPGDNRPRPIEEAFAAAKRAMEAKAIKHPKDLAEEFLPREMEIEGYPWVTHREALKITGTTYKLHLCFFHNPECKRAPYSGNKTFYHAPTVAKFVSSWKPNRGTKPKDTPESRRRAKYVESIMRLQSEERTFSKSSA